MLSVELDTAEVKESGIQRTFLPVLSDGEFQSYQDKLNASVSSFGSDLAPLGDLFMR